MTTTTATSSASGTSQNIVSLLGGGSGIDTKALAQNLVDAEKAPQKALIDAALQKTQAKISGYGTVMSSLATFKAAFAALQDQSKLNTVSVATNSSGYFDVSTTSNAAASTHQISVKAIAEAQSNISEGFAASSTQINGGKQINISFKIGGASQSVTVAAGADTPAGIAAAINAANKGVTAQVVNTGDGSGASYKLVLTATSTGTANAFSEFTATDHSNADTATNSIASLAFSTTLQAAVNAQLTVDGVALTRSTNSISDAVTGMTLNLLAPTPVVTTDESKNVAATVQLSRDTSTVSTNIQALVTAFNSLKSTLKTVSDPTSKVENEGATLVNDSLVRQIQNQITEMVTGLSSSQGTAVNGSSATALRDLGVSIQLDGTLTLDNTKLATALNNNFAGVVKMLTANTDNANSYSSAARGLAGDAVKKLTALMSSTGPILSASSHAASQVSKYNQKQKDLDTRMQSVLARYTQQFTAMDALVGQINSLKTSLTNQFDAMLNTKN
jgi:flagellar hook-associated protein 2